MAESTEDLLRAQLAESQLRCSQIEARLADVSAELDRTRAWRTSVLIAVVVVAGFAILMLGIVAFNAVDDAEALMAFRA
jgi:hypothetical protein